MLGEVLVRINYVHTYILGKEGLCPYRKNKLQHKHSAAADRFDGGSPRLSLLSDHLMHGGTIKPRFKV